MTGIVQVIDFGGLNITGNRHPLSVGNQMRSGPLTRGLGLVPVMLTQDVPPRQTWDFCWRPAGQRIS